MILPKSLRRIFHTFTNMELYRELRKQKEEIHEMREFIKFMDGIVTELNGVVCRLTEPVAEIERKEAMKK